MNLCSVIGKLTSTLESDEIFRTTLSQNNSFFLYITTDQSKYKHNNIQKKKHRDITRNE